MSKQVVFIHVQEVMIVSVPSFKSINRGKRLIKKLSFTDVLVCVVAQFRGLVSGVRVEKRG